MRYRKTVVRALNRGGFEVSSAAYDYSILELRLVRGIKTQAMITPFWN
ncbi:hypothetical protein [Ammoniphilus sp. YIM 78166]|nr:hypothetical protein [Ammoniphilus sp. YIM 78166]